MEDLLYEMARDDYYISIIDCLENGLSFEETLEVVSKLPFARQMPRAKILKDIAEAKQESDFKWS